MSENRQVSCRTVPPGQDHQQFLTTDTTRTDGHSRTQYNPTPPDIFYVVVEHNNSIRKLLDLTTFFAKRY